jgi:hypothetical protein
VRFPLSPGFVAEAAALRFRAGCRHCFHFLADDRCGNGWPLEGQERFPPDAAAADGARPTEVVFCREFELR